MQQLGQLVDLIDPEPIEEFVDVLFAAWADRRCELDFGKGGSVLTASHLVLGLVKTSTGSGEQARQAMSLASHVGLITALGNDMNFARVFQDQLASDAIGGDIAVAISASSNSSNVVHACRWAKLRKLNVVALTGCSGEATRRRGRHPDTTCRATTTH